jgi:hypothetical protein
MTRNYFFKFYIISFSLISLSIIPYSFGGLFSIVLWCLPICYILKFKTEINVSLLIYVVLYCTLTLFISLLWAGTKFHIKFFHM